MNFHVRRVGSIALLALTGCGLWQDDGPKKAAARSEREGVEVKLCDGETTTRVPKDMKRTRENGQQIADALMSQWRHRHPERDWVEQEQTKHKIVPPAKNDDL